MTYLVSNFGKFLHVATKFGAFTGNYWPFDLHISVNSLILKKKKIAMEITSFSHKCFIYYMIQNPLELHG